jgi:hypothetical protein
VEEEREEKEEMNEGCGMALDDEGGGRGFWGRGRRQGRGGGKIRLGRDGDRGGEEGGGGNKGSGRGEGRGASGGMGSCPRTWVTKKEEKETGWKGEDEEDEEDAGSGRGREEGIRVPLLLDVCEDTERVRS